MLCGKRTFADFLRIGSELIAKEEATKKKRIGYDGIIVKYDYIAKTKQLNASKALLVKLDSSSINSGVLHIVLSFMDIEAFNKLGSCSKYSRDLIFGTTYSRNMPFTEMSFKLTVRGYFKDALLAIKQEKK